MPSCIWTWLTMTSQITSWRFWLSLVTVSPSQTVGNRARHQGEAVPCCCRLRARDGLLLPRVEQLATWWPSHHYWQLVVLLPWGSLPAFLPGYGIPCSQTKLHSVPSWSVISTSTKTSMPTKFCLVAPPCTQTSLTRYRRRSFLCLPATWSTSTK